jgi:hypothetical protein
MAYVNRRHLRTSPTGQSLQESPCPLASLRSKRRFGRFRREADIDW